MERGFLALTAALALFLLTAPHPLQAQTDRNDFKRQVAEELFSDDGDDSEGAFEEAVSQMEALMDAPLTVSEAQTDRLGSLPFVSERHLAAVRQHLAQGKPIRTVGELAQAARMNSVEAEFLPYFVRQSEPLPSLTDSPARAHTGDRARRQSRPLVTLEGNFNLPFYERRGDKNGYLGLPYRHELRCNFTLGPHVSGGFLGAQDSGEPFFGSYNRWGYDHYAAHLRVKDVGILSDLLLGQYRLTWGQGLIAGGSRMAGKSAWVNSGGRTGTGFTPNASRSVDGYYQGVAAKLSPRGPFSLSAMVSWRPIDGRLDGDSAVRTIVRTGYHRTPGDMAVRHTASETVVGGAVGYESAWLRLSLQALHTRYSLPLRPKTTPLYRRYYPAGRTFSNASLAYAASQWGLTLSGETALDGNGHMATLNTLSLAPTRKSLLTVVQRFYSYRYDAPHAGALADGGAVKNESGISGGGKIELTKWWHIEGCADFAYFPWARYGTSLASHASDISLLSRMVFGRLRVKMKYRRHSRQRDNTAKTALQDETRHTARLSLGYPIGRRLRLTTQGDYARQSNEQHSGGWMVSQSGALKKGRIAMDATAAWFKTDDYASRIYLFEPTLNHVSGFPSYYGHGLHLSLLAKVRAGKRLDIGAKLSYTDYFDRSQVGSGLQQVDHSHLTDLMISARLRLL